MDDRNVVFPRWRVRAHVVTLARSASKGTLRSSLPLRIEPLRQELAIAVGRNKERSNAAPANRIPPAGTALRLVRPTPYCVAP